MASDAFQRYSIAHQFELIQGTAPSSKQRQKCLEFAYSHVILQKKALNLPALLAFVNCFAKTDPELVKDVFDQSTVDPSTLATGLTVMLTHSERHLDRILHTICSVCLVSSPAASALSPALSRLASAHAQILQDQPLSAYDALYAAFLIIKASYLVPHLSFEKLEELSVAYAGIQNAPLAGQLESDFQLSQKIRSAAEPDVLDDPTLDYVCGSLAQQAPSEKLLDQINQGKVDRKGKGKAVEESRDEALDEAVAQVLAILPDQDGQAVAKHFKHPRFAGPNGYDTEKLISAILEGDLPDAPPPLEESLVEAQPQVPAAERRNIYDSEKIDPTKLRWNKQSVEQTDADLLSDQLKGNIIALAEAESDDDELYQNWGDPFAKRSGLREASLEELEDGIVDPAIPIGGDDVSSDQEGEAKPSKDPFSPVFVKILSETYLEQGLEPFLRAKGPKLPPARQALLNRLKDAGFPTGKEDLVTSWAQMLDRDPQKEKRLAPYAWRGNTVAPVQEFGTSQTSEQRGRGRGGRGSRGRGGGQRRQRGHDKKMRGQMG